MAAVSERSNLLLLLLLYLKVEANFYRIVKITITEKLPCLSVCPVCLSVSPPTQTDKLGALIVAWGQYAPGDKILPQQADCSDLTRST